ncbi:MAG: heavy-metal-associated domain-containing protein [Dermatophilaceae bacterium]
MNTTTLKVDGLTCGHCVQHVTTELTAIDGVTAVDVDLVAGGTSTVRVTSTGPIGPEQFAEAVDEAGYTLSTREG